MPSVAPQLQLATVLAASGLDWIVPEWTAPANVCALSTTRNGGCSGGPYATMNLGRSRGDDASALAENERRFRAFLPAPPVPLRQVHGAQVATLDNQSPNAMALVADAAVTREPDVVCSILTADCLPVLFADSSGEAVGIAHAGWRGLAGGVLEGTVVALGFLGVTPDRVLAWLGPGIGPASFEVGDDVPDAFSAADRAAAGCFVRHGVQKWRADLYALARRRLEGCGVTQVFGGGFCTFIDSPRFFSYRRERESGRMATAIWLAGDRSSATLGR